MADEFLVKIPRNPLKKYNVMRFAGGDVMDIQKWMGADICRDMSAKKIYQDDEVYPEFGAGSEYGRKQKEQARKLKYGMKLSKFNADNQPWNLSINMMGMAPYSAKNKNKNKMIPVTKEFIGRKEGGIGEGSMYFVFMQTPNHTFEAYPVDSWYNFTRKIKHRTLTDEEAEAEWDKRDKILNHLNFMARKRLQIDEEKEGEEEGKAGKNKTSTKTKKDSSDGFVIHDEAADDELLMSESDDESDDGKIEKSKEPKQKGLKHDAPEEAHEESDDGDEEGQEHDYDSDISSADETANDSMVAPKGLDEEESSSSSEEEESKPDDTNDDVGQKSKAGDGASTSGESEVDSDIEKEGSVVFMNGRKAQTKGKKSNSRSPTPNSEVVSGSKKKSQEAEIKADASGRSSSKVIGLLGKRQATSETVDVGNVKRQKLIPGSGNAPSKDSSSQSVLNEEAVIRYLRHKPITPKDLLKKFKKKKTSLTSEQIVATVAAILKKINPEQTKIGGKMHLYLKQT